MNQEEIAVSIAEHNKEIGSLKHRVVELEEKTDRIESLTLSVQKLAQSVEVMAKEQVDYRTKQNEIASRLLEVEQAPIKAKAKKHDDTWQYIWHVVLGLVIGIVASD